MTGWVEGSKGSNSKGTYTEMDFNQKTEQSKILNQKKHKSEF